jgi:hypothetical protein
MDKGGCAFGPLLLAQEGNKDYALELVRLGLAGLDGYTQMPAAFTEAEEGAKAARLGMWLKYTGEDTATDYAQSAGGNDGGAAAAMANLTIAGVRKLRVKVVEVVSGGHFFVQVQGDPQVELVNGKMAELGQEVGWGGAPFEPKKRMGCAALWGESWCR